METSHARTSTPAPHARSIGRYVMYDQIGAGGMASVHFGRLRGPAGFSRTVAIKRLHPHLARVPQFSSRFISEAKLAARIRHPNVVALLDVVALDSGELLLVMEYVHGEPLAALLASTRLQGKPLAPALAAAVMSGALEGLHAAHEAVSETGRALVLVHGDVSPRNLIVDVEGGTRVLDFGVAKIGPGAAEGLSRLGTPGYIAPEKLEGDRFDRRADVFSAGAVLWETLCLRRLFAGPDRAANAHRPAVVPPSTFNPAVSPALDAVVLRALAPRPEQRFPTARHFALELQRACAPASAHEVSAWVARTRGEALRRRARALERIETISVAELSARELAPDDPAEEPPTVVSPPVPAPAALPQEAAGPLHEAPRQEEIPTAVEETPAPPIAHPDADPPTVCERRTPVLAAEAPAPPPPEALAADARLPGNPLLLPAGPARRATLRSAAPAVALFALAWLASALTAGESAPAGPASPASTPRAVWAPAATVATCAPRTTLPPASVALLSRAEDPAGTPAAPEAAVRPPPAAIADVTTIVALNRKAIGAYEQLEPRRALQLLSRALRLCGQAGPTRGHLAALTHLNTGVVLAGGFKQRELAVEQFRRALALRPQIELSGGLASPEIRAAFTEARIGGAL
jgi:serine/threonine protein kinase